MIDSLQKIENLMAEIELDYDETTKRFLEAQANEKILKTVLEAEKRYDEIFEFAPPKDVLNYERDLIATRRSEMTIANPNIIANPNPIVFINNK